MIYIRELTPRTRIVYFALDYQQGPVFAKFVSCRTDQQGWVVTSLKFSMDEDAILPAQPLQE